MFIIHVIVIFKDYELLYKGSKTGSYLTIEKKEGGVVPVAVWEVTAADEHSLDAYEGCPNFYYKKNMKSGFPKPEKRWMLLCISCMKNAGFGFQLLHMSAPANSDTPFSDLISSTLMKHTKKA